MRSKSNLTRQVKQAPSGPIQSSVDSLIQGVSQQPPHLRVTGQGEEQVNGWSSPVEGLCKRNPLRHVARILPGAVTDFYLEMLNVASQERYSVMVYPKGGSLTGFLNVLITLNGQPATIDVHGSGLAAVGAFDLDPAFPSNQVTTTTGGIDVNPASYLGNAVGNLERKYVLINNGPLGLLLNREKVTAMSSATTPAAKNEGLVFIQGVAYEMTYKTTLDGVALADVTTPKATDTNNTISTSLVAQAIAAEINKDTNFTATTDKYIVKVVRKDGGPFTLNVDDGRGNSLARVVKGSVSTVGELPTHAPNGFTVKVTGVASDSKDDRWVTFTTADGTGFGDGTWAETAAPGIQYKLDENTMPLVIYRAARGVLFIGPADGATRTITTGGQTYSYTFPTWGQRTAGNQTTVPTPDFVGKPIRDHVIFRGRYAVCAGQSVVFSETNDIFNFFQDTSVAQVATDPFGVLASSEISSELNWLLPIDESVMAFSQYSQFQVRAADADVLTPTTAIILRISNIQMNPYVRPKLAGPQVLFATDEFGYTHFREYMFTELQQRRSGLNLGSSGDICINIPKYIPGLVTHWDVGETIDLMVCSTPADRRTLYVYKYLYQSTSQAIAKSQSSWSKFTFGGEVRWAKFMDNELWFVVSYPDGTYSGHMTNDEIEIAAAAQVHLDRLILYPECNEGNSPASARITSFYDPDTDVTTFGLPYSVAGVARAVVRYTNGSKQGVMLGSATSGNQIVCELSGDWRNEKIAFGEDYKFSYEFTPMYVPSRDQARQRIVGKQDGRTQVLHLTTHHHNTGRYEVRVVRENRQLDSVHTFRNRWLNYKANQLSYDPRPLENGSFRVPIYSQNDKCRILVESTSWLPVTITGATWEGSYSYRAKGVG